jgi:hypothetical protein
MVAVVQADGDELGHAAPGHGYAHGALDPGQFARVDGGQRAQRLAAQQAGRVVVHQGGQVADMAFGVEQAGLFLALGAESQQFHGVSWGMGSWACSH